MEIGCRVERTPADHITRDHMAAPTVPPARYVDAAKKAGWSTSEINAALMEITAQTIFSEFWTTDSEGRVKYTNMPEVGFTFPSVPDANTQAAPLAKLLQESKIMVEQNTEMRE